MHSRIAALSLYARSPFRLLASGLMICRYFPNDLSYFAFVCEIIQMAFGFIYDDYLK